MVGAGVMEGANVGAVAGGVTVVGAVNVRGSTGRVSTWAIMRSPVRLLREICQVVPSEEAIGVTGNSARRADGRSAAARVAAVRRGMDTRREGIAVSLEEVIWGVGIKRAYHPIKTASRKRQRGQNTLKREVRA